MNQMGRAAGPLSASGRLSPVPILQTATGFWASQALMTAVELRLFTVLFGGPKSAAEVAAELGTDTGTTRSQTPTWSKDRPDRTSSWFGSCTIRSSAFGSRSATR